MWCDIRWPADLLDPRHPVEDHTMTAHACALKKMHTGFHRCSCGESMSRQTGRTSRMLEEALRAVLNGKRVLIVAPKEEIRKHLIQMANSMGLPLHPNDFTTVAMVLSGKHRGFQGRLFEDHTMDEVLTGKVRERYAHEVGIMEDWSEATEEDLEELERQDLRRQLEKLQKSSS